MKKFLRVLGHAALGGAAVGAAQWITMPGNVPITAGTALLPIAASALTSVLSLLAPAPGHEPTAK